uniref:Anti-proliferative protein domain-containing protein n=1 Tax=Oncorhynchus tshawytscha TaxID=74940 RepID=A0A8C8JUH4_ONCTS
MKEEIAAAVFFVARLAKRHGSLDAESREEFAAALTSALFDTYKTHWYPHTPVKGQAYRCLRMNRAQLRDPVLERACLRSAMTIWVDPGEVSCCSDEEDGDTSMNSSCSSLSAPCPAHNPKPKTIPTVSNPNSVYQVTNQVTMPPPPAWAAYSNRRAFPGDGYPPRSQFQPPKGIKPYRATSSFTGPRQDKYHWVSKNRS